MVLSTLITVLSASWVLELGEMHCIVSQTGSSVAEPLMEGPVETGSCQDKPLLSVAMETHLVLTSAGVKGPALCC